MNTIKELLKGKENIDLAQFYSVISSLENLDKLLLEVIVNMQQYKSTWDITFIALAVMIAKNITEQECFGIILDCVNNNINLITDTDVRPRIGNIPPLPFKDYENLFKR